MHEGEDVGGCLYTAGDDFASSRVGPLSTWNAEGRLAEAVRAVTEHGGQVLQAVHEIRGRTAFAPSSSTARATGRAACAHGLIEATPVASSAATTQAMFDAPSRPCQRGRPGHQVAGRRRPHSRAGTTRHNVEEHLWHASGRFVPLRQRPFGRAEFAGTVHALLDLPQDAGAGSLAINLGAATQSMKVTGQRHLRIYRARMPDESGTEPT